MELEGNCEFAGLIFKLKRRSFGTLAFEIMVLILAALIIGVLTWLAFYFLERWLAISERMLVSIPVALTILLVIWTVAVSPFSQYGDNWAIIPALVLAPIVVAWHLSLLGVRLGEWACRRDILVSYGSYGLLHLVIFIPVWFYCLMWISKNGP